MLPEILDNHLRKIFFLWLISVAILFFVFSDTYTVIYSKYPIIENPFLLFIEVVLALLAVPLLPPILVFGMARKYIWGHRTNVVLAVLAVPLIMFWVTALFAFIFFIISLQHSGAIQAPNGVRLWQTPVAPYPNWENLYFSAMPEWDEYWAVYGGTRGLLNIYYFSAQALLGFSYGEYIPIGSIRPIVVLEALTGKILDIVLVSIGISLLLERNKKRSNRGKSRTLLRHKRRRTSHL